ncbi:tetratricopeptide repeat protein [Stieleria sp. ICT_E10.1]|uniref:tetratricopeptide repeat protein n=1 Tax=Stieleria sedimenti TaxID=2976331 RepID=UPI00218080A8|nr:tetratricopeptide repeat protein [Stieleria sedimenti]MCS7470262.1 tetratricopeptide repeat protein [Stieleria sedimenti]
MKSTSNLAAGLLFVTVLLFVGCRNDSATMETGQTSSKPTADAPSVPDVVSSPDLTDRVPEIDRSPLEPTRDPASESTPATVAADEPQLAAEDLHDAALTALESGDLDRAFAFARKATSTAPDDPQSTFLMARVLAERNRFPEAVKMLDDLLVELPDARLPIYGQTADWLVLQGRYDEAEKRYREILKEVPDASMAQRPLAQLLLRQGRRFEAATYLRQLCQSGVVEPSNLRSLLRLAYPFAADADTDELEPIGPLGRARVEVSRGNWQDALQTLKQTDSNDPDLDALVGRIHAQSHNQGQDSEALTRWAQSALPTQNDAPDYWFAIATHHADQGEHQEAVRCLCNVITRDPTDEASYRMMAESLNALELDDRAAEASRRAELIAETHRIGEQMASDQDVDLDQVSRLAELLDELSRPLEALGWRTVRVALERSRGTLSAQDASQAIAQINRDRLQRLQSGVAESTEAFDAFLCRDPEGTNTER